MSRDDMSKDEIIARIKEAKRKTGLGIFGFCRKFRMNPKTVNGWLSGRSVPPVYVVYMIERILEYESEFGVLDYTGDGAVRITDNSCYYQEGSARTQYYSGWKGCSRSN